MCYVANLSLKREEGLFNCFLLVLLFSAVLNPNTVCIIFQAIGNQTTPLKVNRQVYNFFKKKKFEIPIAKRQNNSPGVRSLV